VGKSKGATSNDFAYDDFAYHMYRGGGGGGEREKKKGGEIEVREGVNKMRGRMCSQIIKPRFTHNDHAQKSSEHENVTEEPWNDQP
jgi:hypothetical protein